MSQLFDDESAPKFDVGQVWQQCLDDLQLEMAETDLRYIRPLKTKLVSRVLILFAPNPLLVRKVKDEYLPKIKTCVFKYAGNVIVDVAVELMPASTEQISTPKKNKSHGHGQAAQNGNRLVESDDLNDLFTFEAFVKGKSNSHAYEACYELSKKDYNHSYGPIFIYGSSGLGKTHLMHAIAHRYCKYGKSFYYFTKDSFYEKVGAAFRDGKIEQFSKQVCQADLLIVDDVHLFDSKNAPKITQILTELFEKFTQGNKKQVIVASDRQPSQMKGFDDRFISRFSGSLSLPIEPPDMDMRVQILNKKAALLGFDLPKECALFMAQNLPPDVRGLEGALKQVELYAKLRGESISLSLVGMALKDSIAARAKALNAENIRDVVAGFYDVSPKDLMGKKRSRNIARPRQVAMALIRELTRDSFPEIGQVFGGRDHTTVMHACDKIEELRAADPTVEKDYQTLKIMLEFA